MATTMVIAGSNPGSKLKDAVVARVPVIALPEFLVLSNSLAFISEETYAAVQFREKNNPTSDDGDSSNASVD